MSKTYRTFSLICDEKPLFFSYGETELHIANECPSGNSITFALAQDSIFTEKFGEAISYVFNSNLLDPKSAIQIYGFIKPGHAEVL